MLVDIEKQKTVKRTIKSIFITFKQRFQKTAFFKLLPRTNFQNIFFCFKKFMIKGSSILVKNPSDPINFNWKNFNLKTYNKVIRRCVSWLAFFALFSLRRCIF